MQVEYENFTLIVSKLCKVIRKIKTKEVEEYNLKSSHVTIMYFMYNYTNITLKQLCDYCEEDKASISRAIESLKKLDLVNNAKTSSVYKQPLVLTEKGINIAMAISQKIDFVVETATQGLTEADRDVMYTCLNTICTNLEKIVSYGE